MASFAQLSFSDLFCGSRPWCRSIQRCATALSTNTLTYQYIYLLDLVCFSISLVISLRIVNNVVTSLRSTHRQSLHCAVSYMAVGSPDPLPLTLPANVCEQSLQLHDKMGVKKLDSTASRTSPTQGSFLAPVKSAEYHCRSRPTIAKAMSAIIGQTCLVPRCSMHRQLLGTCSSHLAIPNFVDVSLGLG